MQVKATNGMDLDAVVLVDTSGTPYAASGGGGGSGGAVTGNIASNSTDSGNPVKIGGVYNSGNLGLPVALTTGQRGDNQVNARGFISIAASGLGTTTDSLPSPAGTQDIAGITRSLLIGGSHYNGATWDRARGDTTGAYVVQKPATSGGTATAKVISAASTNATIAKAGAGQVYGMQFANTSASWRFVKFYNKATAPIVGTDAVVDIVGIPPGGRVEINRTLGMPFAAGIAYAITGAYADNDATAIGAGEVVGSIQYA